MLRLPQRTEVIGFSYGQSLYPDLANNEDHFWSCPFSLDDIDDFQVSLPCKREEVVGDHTQWHLPSLANGFHRYLRVIISSRDEATVEIIITDPTLPEYRIVNQTDHVIHFGQMKETPFWQKQDTIESLLIKGRFMAVDPHSDIPFTWESRVPAKRIFGIKVG